MTTNLPAPEWVDINAAAVLVGKSVSTIRRIIRDGIEPEHISRQPMQNKGGEKILLRRAYLVQRFGVASPERATEPETDADAGALVDMLNRQLEVKDRQIGALQREVEAKSRQIEQAQQAVGELSESLKQFAALTISLQKRLTERTEPAPASEPAPVGYMVALSVVLSLIGVLFVYLVIQVFGHG